MESITKNVRDISLPDTLALEHVIGRQLAEIQQVTIQICSLKLQNELRILLPLIFEHCREPRLAARECDYGQMLSLIRKALRQGCMRG